MKIRKILFTSLSLPILPAILLSSCSTQGEDAPIKLDKSVFETGNKNAFNDIFNLLDNQTTSDSFIKKTTEEINKAINDEISKNQLIQEKLKIYFFSSIYNSLNNVVDIIDNNIQQIPPINERQKGIDALKKIIDDSIIKPESANNQWKKYDSLEAELNKITDMKITLSSKRVDKLQSEWTWETSFKLAEDSELRKILKIQNDNGVDEYVDKSIFYKRQISVEERNEARQNSFIDGVFNEAKYQSNLRQLIYQSSEWFWDGKEQIVTSIKKESNLNPYSTNGTSGGFTTDGAKRTEFAIDFEQHPSNIKLYKPVFLFQTNKIINSTFINSEWDNFLKFKGYKNSDDIEQDPKKVQDIRIDLKSSYIEYNKKV